MIIIETVVFSSSVISQIGQENISDSLRPSVRFDFDSIVVFGEQYTNQDTTLGERPPQTLRGYLHGSGSVFGVETSTDVFWSSELTNDKQDMNRFSVNGKYDQIQFTILDYYPNYGNLSLNGIRSRGGCFVYTPDKFQFEINAGQTQRAVEGDSAENRPAAYQRWMYALRAGYENENKFFTHFSAVKLKDVPHSVLNTFGTAPQENLMGQWDIGFNLLKRIFFKSEFVLSAHSRDLLSTEIVVEKVPDILLKLFKTRTSSSVEYSFKEEMRVVYDRINFYAFYSRVNSGFTSIGTGYLLSDWQEFRFDTRMNFMNRKITCGFYIDHRNNNLANDRLLTTKQTSGGSSLILHPSGMFNCNMTYSVMLETNDAKLDIDRCRNLSHTLFLQPAIDLFGRTATHHFDIIVSVQTLKDLVAVAEQIPDFTTFNLGSNYYINLPWPLTCITSYNMVVNKSSFDVTQRHLVSGRFIWDWFASTVSSSVAVTYSRATADIDNTLDNKRLDVVANIVYRNQKLGKINLDIRHTNYLDKIAKGYSEFVVYMRIDKGL